MALAGVGAGAYFAWAPSSGSAADTPYRLAAVDRGTITASVRATGTLNPVTTVLVGSQLSGQVVEILADYNSPVKAGQVVARLYSRADPLAPRRRACRSRAGQGRPRNAKAHRSTSRAPCSSAPTPRAWTFRRSAIARRRSSPRRSAISTGRPNSPRALSARRTPSIRPGRRKRSRKPPSPLREAQIASNKAEIIGLKADIALAEAQVASAKAMILQREAKLKDIEIDLASAPISTRRSTASS